MMQPVAVDPACFSCFLGHRNPFQPFEPALKMFHKDFMLLVRRLHEWKGHKTQQKIMQVFGRRGRMKCYCKRRKRDCNGTGSAPHA